jgi:alpha-L-fucosidase
VFLKPFVPKLFKPLRLSHEIFNKLYWSPIPGIVYIDIPKDRLDKNMTVIAILLDKPIELYREQNGAVESNL